MNDTILGFAIVAIVGAWVSILTAAAAWLYNALGPVWFFVSAALILGSFATVVLYRELKARNAQ